MSSAASEKIFTLSPLCCQEESNTTESNSKSNAQESRDDFVFLQQQPVSQQFGMKSFEGSTWRGTVGCECVAGFGWESLLVGFVLDSLERKFFFFISMFWYKLGKSCNWISGAAILDSAVRVGEVGMRKSQHPPVSVLSWAPFCLLDSAFRHYLNSFFILWSACCSWALLTELNKRLQNSKHGNFFLFWEGWTEKAHIHTALTVERGRRLFDCDPGNTKTPG